MDKETAESYVRYGIKSTKFSKKMCLAFLPFNILMLLIAIALYRGLVFVIIIFILAVANIVTAIIYRKKWCAISGLLSQGTQLILFAMALDCIYFGMYKVANIFVWYEYLISIGTQLVALLVSILLVFNLAKRHNKNKIPVINTVAGSVAGLACVSTSIFCKIFLTEVSVSVILAILSILMNIIILLLCYIISMAYYRVFLIKKYKLNIELEEVEK